MEYCGSIISEIPSLTVALFWSSYMTGSSQNREKFYEIGKIHIKNSMIKLAIHIALRLGDILIILIDMIFNLY